MSPILRIAWRLALVAALLAVPSVTPAEEAPCSLGSPTLSDNQHIEENIYEGGDAGSPWPVSIRDVRRRGPVMQPVPSASVVVPWPGPILALLPGSIPRLVWLPLPIGPAVTGEEPQPAGREAPPAN